MKAVSLRRLRVAPLVLLAVLTVAPPASASHSWGGYHWARTSNPFTVRLGDSVSSAWDSHLRAAASDWSQSSVLDTTIVSGSSWFYCWPRSGRVEVCNRSYGSNGWLGLASVWTNSAGHITQATVEMNDTYFNTTTYNTPDYRRSVMCQEIGHVFGLGHQDETFGNPDLGTCMDYTRTPQNNLRPNQHDYDQLVSIYSHLDSSTTLAASTSSTPGQSAADEHRPPSEWGKAVRYANGNPILFERDLGRGEKHFTWVYWAEGPGPRS